MVVESGVVNAGSAGSVTASLARTPAPPATIGTVVGTQTDCEGRVVVLDESLPVLRALAKARAVSERADAAREHARQQLREAVLAAISAGIAEAEVARRSGVTRVTVRSWIGK